MFSTLMKQSACIVLGLSLMSVSAIAVESESSLVSYSAIVKHAKDGGGRGMDTEVIPKPVAESNQCTVVAKAVVEYKKRRYATAEVASLPSAKCKHDAAQCLVGVSWEQSPAGRLSYRVKATWKLVDC